jgi:hypothetical protein
MKRQCRQRAIGRRPGRLYLNYIHRIASRSSAGARSLTSASRRRKSPSAASLGIVTLERGLIVADGDGTAGQAGLDVRPRRDTAVRHQDRPATSIDVVRGYLSQHFAERTTVMAVSWTFSASAC